MRILTYRTDQGALRPGVALDDQVVDIQSAVQEFAKAEAVGPVAVPTCIEALLEQGAAGLSLTKDAADWAAAHRRNLLLPLSSLRLAPPVTKPQKIIGVGLNYRDHYEEIGREKPSEIQTFAMFANSLVGHREAIILPEKAQRIDWEAELVIVIGKSGKSIPRDEALDHVAGFTAGNDVSVREFQEADPRATRGKSGDTHSPLGPWIALRDELPDDSDLDITLTINGEMKQSSNTSARIFQTPEIVSFLSAYFTLQPGDLIFTGTPGGVGLSRTPQEWLKPGDEVVVSIEGIGSLSNTCALESA